MGEPPAFPTMKAFQTGSSSDLLSRVASFLPQIDAANQTLSNADDAGDAKDSRVDIQLEVDDVDDEDIDESEDQANEKGDDNAKPTIQIKLALGDVDENPAIQWLADQDEEDGDNGKHDKEKDGDQETTLPSAAEDAVKNLLGKRSGEVFPTKQGKKGPLITEIDSS